MKRQPFLVMRIGKYRVVRATTMHDGSIDVEYEGLFQNFCRRYTTAQEKSSFLESVETWIEQTKTEMETLRNEKSNTSSVMSDIDDICKRMR